MIGKQLYRLGLLCIVLAMHLACLGAPAMSQPQPSPTPPAVALPTSEDVAGHYVAMRSDYQDDVGDLKDGIRYWMDLTLVDNPVQVTGFEHVRYVNTSQDALSAIVFRVYPNSLAGKAILTISEVSIGEKAVQPEWADGDSVLRVPLAAALQPGESIEMSLQFVLELTSDLEINYGRLGDLDGVIVLSAFFPLLSVYEQGKWWSAQPSPQGDPAYSEVALFNVTLTAPTDLKVASTGVTLTSVDQDNDMTRRAIVTGPVRDFSLALSRDFECLSAARNGVTVNIWSAPGDGKADQFALEKTLIALSLFDAQYGAYPLAEFDVVEAPISAGGIEYPGLVYLASGLWSEDSDYFEVVLAHEISHQWWYSTVGNDQVNQPWVDESLANYSVEVYYREAYGEEAGRSIRDHYQAALDGYLVDGATQMPVGLPVSAYNGSQYGIFVYDTGALLYSHLREDYGSARLHDFLRACYAQYRYRIMRAEDLRRMVAEFFGADAQRFFDQWVYGG